MIKIEELTVQINGTKILDDITMDIPSSSLSVLVGKNGAGKSTLLKAVCGAFAASKKAVFFGTVALSDIDSAELARRRAVVLQNSKLSFSFSVLEVVLMGRTPHTKNFETDKDYEIALQCMDKMQVSHLEHRDYPTLSGGEQQRVQLAKALAQIWDNLQRDDECYLLLDEPTSSLDIAHQHQLLSLLKELAEAGVTVFTVIHDLNLAAQYGDTITMLKDGKKIASGSAEEIFQSHTIEHAFECPVRVLQNPHFNCPLIVAAGKQHSFDGFAPVSGAHINGL